METIRNLESLLASDVPLTHAQRIALETELADAYYRALVTAQRNF